MVTYYIGLDVHCKFTEMAFENQGKIVNQFTVPTTIRALREALSSVGGRQHIAMEEGPMAGWLYRNLMRFVETVTVSDPRRNKLIASEGDKNDKIDAGKLAMLLRGGYLKAVHHSKNSWHVELKRWTALYHDRIRSATACINKIRAEGRMEGIRIPRRVIMDGNYRKQWLNCLENSMLADRLGMLCVGYDALACQSKWARSQLVTLSRRNTIVRHWSALPGIGDIRAATLLAYLETPWRFRKKSQLWKYCGVGLQYSGSAGVGRLRVPWAVNKRLKNVVMGAALTAIRSHENEYRNYYERMLSHGVLIGNARRSVARKLLTVLWGMWKQQSRITNNSEI